MLGSYVTLLFIDRAKNCIANVIVFNNLSHLSSNQYVRLSKNRNKNEN